MSRNSMLKTKFCDAESTSFSRRSSKAFEGLWTTNACAKDSFLTPTKNEQGGGHFQIEIRLKNWPGSENIFPRVISDAELRETHGHPLARCFLAVLLR